MRWFPIGVLGVHALIHLMGFFKAFGYADLAQLTQPISRAWGVAWLVAACLMATTAAMLGAGYRNYWVVGAVALVVSQAVVFSAWQDAWAGTAANVILLLVVAHGLLTEGPWSFHAQFVRDAHAGLARTIPAPVVTEADLAGLPEPVQRYLRVTRTVGQPRVQNYRLRFRGRIRSAPDSRWMPFEAEQQSFADEPTRLFLMRARMFGVPVEAFHRAVGGRATMQVTIAGVVPIENARGDAMNRAETVTLFNDMCLLAPGTLIDPRITWQSVDATTARARFTYGGQTIAATLFFNSAGELVNFVSDDRSRSELKGTFTARRFSTPVRDYRDFGPVRLMSFGEARWLLPEGEFTYGEFTLVEIAYNNGDDRGRPRRRITSIGNEATVIATPSGPHPMAIRYSLGGLLAFGALNALGGGYYGLTGAVGVPTQWLEGSPFEDYFVPSLILLIVVGGSFIVAAIAVFARLRAARFAVFMAAFVVLGWLTVQIAIIGYVSWMQPATAIAGVLVLILGSQLPRHERIAQ